jgi:hypothetical protein
MMPMINERYEAIDPNTGEPMRFEPYVPKHRLMQRLAENLMWETPDGVFYRSSDGSLGYVPHASPPLQASDERRAMAPTY